MDPPSRLAALGRRRLALTIVVLGGTCAIGPASTDLYLPAMPTVAADLRASNQVVALTITTFVLGLALGQLVAGPLSDVYGRRNPLLAGMALFAVSSLACALTPSAEVLVAARLVQGLAAAFGMVITNAVVTDYSRGRDAARLLSRLALISLLAPVIAPLVGSQLLHVMSWRGVYLVLVALGALVTAGVAIWLRESLPAERRRPGGVSATLRTMASLSRDSTFMGLAVSGALISVTFFAYLTAASFVYQDVYGLSPLAFSVLFATNAVGMIIASQLNHLLLSRFTPLRLLGAGIVIVVLAGGAALVVQLIGGLGIVALTVPLFILVTAVGVVSPDATAIALSRHPEVAGSASAYFGSFRLTVGALATPLVAIGGSVSALPMALVIALSGAAALAVFALIAGKAASTTAMLDMPEEASSEMSVG